MGTAMCVLGTNVPGIKELIEHNKNGWLCATTANNIKSSLDTLLSDRELRKRLGTAARAKIVHHYSLDRVVATEKQVIQTLLGSPHV